MMDMKKGMMFGMECYFEELISRDLIKSAKLLEISEFNYDIARQNEYGQYELIKEEDIAKERLLEGKGIFYNGYVVFYAGIRNEHMNRYRFEKKKKEVEYRDYLGGIIYENIQDLYFFPIVKSIIELYQNGVFEEDVARQKLEKYLPEGVVCSLLSQEELAQLVG